MTDGFAQRWGCDAADLGSDAPTSHGELLRVAVLQLLAIVLILYMVRPACVVYREARYSTESFHFSAAIAIAVIVTVLTWAQPLRGLRRAW